jgi:hypothetical protein
LVDDNKVKRCITKMVEQPLMNETTRSRDASTPKGRGVSAEDCIGMTTVSTKEGWETKDDSEPEGPQVRTMLLVSTTVAGHKRVR